MNHQDTALMAQPREIHGLTVRPLTLGSFLLLRSHGNALLEDALAGRVVATDDLTVERARDLAGLVFAHAAPEELLSRHYAEGDAAGFHAACARWCSAVPFAALGDVCSVIFQSVRAAGAADVEPVPDNQPAADPNSVGRSGRP